MKSGRLDRIEEDIKDIKDNHLTTIYGALNKVRTRVWYILGVLFVLVPLTVAILAKVW